MLDAEYMTPGEVCEYLRISRWTLNNLVRNDKFAPCLTLSNKLKRWRRSDIEKWEKIHERFESARK
jgi:predicted DNA-binding transcriptional regulator AlpA